MLQLRTGSTAAAIDFEYNKDNKSTYYTAHTIYNLQRKVNATVAQIIADMLYCQNDDVFKKHLQQLRLKSEDIAMPKYTVYVCICSSLTPCICVFFINIRTWIFIFVVIDN